MRTAGWGRLGRVPLRFPLEILSALAAKAASVRGDGHAYLPGVRIDLAARHASYEGNVLAIEERGDGTLVLFRSVGDGLTYLHLGVHEPFGITVYEPDDQLELLGGDRAVRWSQDDALTQLQAKRAVAEVGGKLEKQGVKLDVSGVKWKEAGVENNNVRDIVAAIDSWWLEAGSDAVGADALRGIKTISVVSGESEIAKTGDVLTVGIGKAGYDSADALVAAIEKAL